MVLKILGSSSSGNSYLLESDTECLMIECGIPMKEVKKALNFNVSKVAGCLVSHQHGDHCKHLRDVLETGIPIYTNDETVEAVEVVYGELLHGVPEKKPFNIGGFRITPFYVPHDGTPCFAYKIFHEDIGNLLFLTDLKYCKYRFKDINHIMCEANYSKGIINQDNPNFQHVAKGHMEIETTLDFLRTNDNPLLVNVVLLHLSDSNSSESLFHKKTKEAVPYANVYVADKGMEIELSKEPF